MKAVSDQYLPDEVDRSQDYYASPYLAPEELLSKMPKTVIYSAMNDPLRDDQIRFARKMQKAGGNIRMVMFRYLEHGVLGHSESAFFGAKIYKDEVMKGFKRHLEEIEKNKQAKLDEGKKVGDEEEGNNEGNADIEENTCEEVEKEEEVIKEKLNG